MVGELEEQLATLQKSKQKLEKERHTLTAETGDLNSHVEALQKAKVSLRQYSPFLVNGARLYCSSHLPLPSLLSVQH